MNIIKDFLKFLATAAFAIGFAALMAVVVLEWMAGCGETYIDAKGVRHQNECIFLNHPSKESK